MTESKSKAKGFFFAMSIIFFIVMLIGFAPSFFFRRSMMNRGPLPPIFIIHSVLNVAFLCALISQSWLVMKNKIVNHKRNGIFWFLLSIALVVVNFMIIHIAAQKPFNGKDPYEIGTVIGNSIGTLQFIIFVSLSYFYRHKPDIHKRLLLFIGIVMLGVAFARFPERYEILRFDSVLANFLVYNVAAQIVLGLAILIHDIITRKRPHFVTVISLSLNFVFHFIFFYVVLSGLGMKYVEFLKSI